MVLPQPVELNGARICAISAGMGSLGLCLTVSEAGHCLWWVSDETHGETHVVDREVAERTALPPRRMPRRGGS